MRASMGPLALIHLRSWTASRRKDITRKNRREDVYSMTRYLRFKRGAWGVGFSASVTEIHSTQDILWVSIVSWLVRRLCHKELKLRQRIWLSFPYDCTLSGTALSGIQPSTQNCTQHCSSGGSVKKCWSATSSSIPTLEFMHLNEADEGFWWTSALYCYKSMNILNAWILDGALIQLLIKH